MRKPDGDLPHLSRQIARETYVAALLATLPRRNEWVFSSAYALDMSEHNIKRRAS